jgi:predicted RNA methylase
MTATTGAYLPGFEREQRKPELSQWYTEPRLAKAVWRWANRYDQPRSVLEPACGHGALVRPLIEEPFACRNVVLIDVDPSAVEVCAELCAVGRRRPGMTWEVDCADFLELTKSPSHESFDLALMNPPYEEGRAEEFIVQALTIAKRVVGIFKASIQHGSSRFRMLWSVAYASREARLASRPSFGQGESGRQGMTDYVVLEIKRLAPGQDVTSERWVLQEHWP